MLETSLYGPVKSYLESLGLTVKGEIGGCDIVALSASSPPVVVVCELKLQFNLELVLQGVDRMAVSDEVWLAAPLSARGKGREADARFRSLCRRLGIGLLGIAANGAVHVLLSPAALPPRRNPQRRSRLVVEHQRRRGDPAAGGSTRVPIMTVYRQEALACAEALKHGPKRPRDLKAAMPNASKILLHNYYNWFARVDRGVYDLTDAGRQALERWPQTELSGSASPASLSIGV